MPPIHIHVPIRPHPPTQSSLSLTLTLTTTYLRPFHSTPITPAKSTRARLAHIHSNIPPYPYGPSQVYKQSNFGLYGLSKIRFGNQVSSRNEIKTRRFWRPNVQVKKLWSEALGTWVRTRVTARVLRTVDKVGGLDEYLLGGKRARVRELGMGGWALRWRVLQTEGVRERLRREREALGLGLEVGGDGREVLLGVKGNLATGEEVRREVEAFDRELEKGAVVGIGDEEELMETRRGEGMEDGEEFMREEESGRSEKRAVL